MSVPTVAQDAYIPGNPRRDRDEIVARLVAHGVGVVKAGKISKAALRTADPAGEAERLYSEHRRVETARVAAAADREHGHRIKYKDPTGDKATWNVLYND